MRKDYGNRKNRLAPVKVKAYCTYQIDGLNLDRFINHLALQGITLYSVKKITNKRLIVSVNYLDSKKFFAIAKSLCYNIKKVKSSGRDFFLIRLYKRIGLILGAVVFLLAVLSFNDLVLSVDFVGSGSAYKREVQEILSKKSIGEFSRFSNIDLRALEDQILSESNSFSFVSCKKQGSRLVIELILSDGTDNALSGNVEKMNAKTFGVVERIKVYRGTALVSEGDYVEIGDLLVSGYATIKEQQVFVGVIAYVSILSEYFFEYTSEQDNLEDVALIMFRNELNQDGVAKERVEKQESNGKFVYKCTITVRREFTVG